MTRLSRVLAALAAAGLAVPFWASAASAATLAETASVGAYYLATNPGVVGGVPENPLGGQKAPDNAKSADGVAEDDLGVAVVAPGQPDKFSALQWDLLDLGLGAVVSSATLTIPFSTKDGSTSSDKDPTLIAACLGGPEGFGDGDGQPFQDAPSVLCAEGSAPAQPAEGGNALQFDVTAIAQKWAEGGNNGLVLYPSEAGLGRPFQSVFADKSQARLTIAFTAESLDDLLIDDFGAGTDPVDGGFLADDSSAGTGGFEDTSFAADAGSGTAAFSGGALATPELPADGPEVAAPTSRPVTRAAAPIAPMAFDAATWAAMVGGAALLAVVSLALGAPTTTGAAARAMAVRPGGVASALASRRAGLASALRT